jgi:uncharacterized membrane protein YkoI
MKTIIKVFATITPLLGAACDDGESTGIDDAEAARLAEDAVGGEAKETERSKEGTLDVWEVHVAMGNGATLEVKLDLEDGDVVVVEDRIGPFDYPDFTPSAGVLAYDAILALAKDEVSGDVEAWEFKREGGEEADEVEFEYEFYIRDAESQLWEIKFDATDGAATSLEAKDAVDE